MFSCQARPGHSTDRRGRGSASRPRVARTLSSPLAMLPWWPGLDLQNFQHDALKVTDRCGSPHLDLIISNSR